eukprot:m.138081 g.138081  ORF g.138081 m.138081 type:complete len:53 (+) comp16064_c0_seq3:638-796(+)
MPDPSNGAGFHLNSSNSLDQLTSSPDLAKKHAAYRPCAIVAAKAAGSLQTHR